MIIAPSQAMLILLDKYSKLVKKMSHQLEGLEATDPQHAEIAQSLSHSQEMLQTLKALYITGAQTPEQKEQLSVLMKDEALEGYEISYSFSVIDRDPSRRYFESHLSYETAKDHFKDLSLSDLEKHRDFLLESIGDGIKPAERDALRGVFDESKFTSLYAKDKAKQEGKSKASTPDFGPAEFADVIYAIRHSPLYSEFSADDKEKLVCMMQSCYLAVIGVMLHNDRLPFSDVAKKAPYDAQSRGRKLKTDDDITQLDVTTNVAGIMRNTMPISRNDILYREEGFKYLKPADRCYFDEKAAFIVKTFESALNTFSCSISGTTLCQIKMLADAAMKGQLEFDNVDKLKDFIRGFISSVQFNGGGHTMIEFCSVLALPEIQQFFDAHVPGFSEIDVSSLFLQGNERAFDKAIKDSIDYNATLMKRGAVLDEMHRSFKEASKTETDAPAISTLPSQEIKTSLQAIKSKPVDANNGLDEEEGNLHSPSS